MKYLTNVYCIFYQICHEPLTDYVLKRTNMDVTSIYNVPIHKVLLKSMPNTSHGLPVSFRQN